MPMHKVDVIVTCYNYGRYIDECLTAVVGQTYGDFNIWLIDNASTDNTQELAQRWEKRDSRVNYIKNDQNIGFHGSVKKAMAATSAELVVILPVDDLWAPDFLASTVTALNEHPEVAMAYTRWTTFKDVDGNRQHLVMFVPHEGSGLVDDRDLLVGNNWIPLSFGVFRRECFIQVGGIKDGLSHLGDYDLWLQMAARWPFYFCDGLLGFIREHEQNWSKELIKSGKTADEYISVDDSIFADQVHWPVHTRLLVKARQIMRFTGKPLIEITREMLHNAEAIQRDRIALCKPEFLYAVANLILSNLQTGPKNVQANLAPGPFGGVQDGLEVLDWLLQENPDDAKGRRLYDCFSQHSAAANKYRNWLKRHSLQEIDAQLLAERMTLRWKERPAFNIVLMAEPGQESLLADTLDSLATQFYTGWRLVVVAAAPAPDAAFQESESLRWIEVHTDAERVAALNELVAGMGSGWLLALPPGGRLEPHSLIRCGDYINLHPEWRLVYWDDDRLNGVGECVEPRFKPDFNLDFLRSTDYIGPSLVRADALREAGGYSALPGAEGYDMILRVLDHQGEKAIGHIADVLLHLPSSWESVGDESNSRKAVAEHLSRCGIQGDVVEGYAPGTHRVIYQRPADPLVSIIIPNRDKLEFLQPCVESVLEKTSYQNYEILIVDNQSVDPDVLDYYRELQQSFPGKLRVLSYDAEFNFSAMNNLAARQAKGEYLLLLNNDTQTVQSEWLERLLSYGQRSDVGIVGARLVYPESGKLQHAGVVLGMSNIADHPFHGVLTVKDGGYMNRAQVDQNYSAVTAACLLVRKSIYEQVGGMDEERFKVLFNDVDLCLKVRELGCKIVWTPYVTAVHHCSISLKSGSADLMKIALSNERSKRERGAMMERWLPQLANDPAYNRHLSLIPPGYQVEGTVVIDWDTNFHDRPRILSSPLSGGSGEYRVIGPFRALSRAGLAQCDVVQMGEMFKTRILMPTEIERAKPDTLVLQTAIDDAHLQALELYKTHNTDVLKVYALDDLMTQIPKQNAFYRYSYRDAKPRMRKALALCDRAVVSTEPLAELCRSMIEEVHVIPNRLERALWGDLKSKRRQSAKPRVGWAGAQQHAGDLALIEEVVKATALEVDWVFFGMCPESLRPYIREFHDFVLSFYDYPAKLASLNLDLAVAPLDIHPFNEAKSNLRLLEYGMLGWPVVCTDIYPYQNAPVKRIANNDPQAWVEAIRERVHDLDAAEKEGDQLRGWVHKNFMLEDHLDEWMRALVR